MDKVNQVIIKGIILDLMSHAQFHGTQEASDS
jgi:hypothetical protein